MSNLVIVALPEENDYIHKISSEKVPHMTLLFLGEDATQVKNLTKILDFVGHAASTSLTRFGLEVDRRGELGPKPADVLFFSKSKWSGIEAVVEYKSYLLKEPNIRSAYDSTEQHPEWIPHITLGFPDSPAKPDERDYPGINYVSFDRIAVWFGEYEGVEFPLKRYEGNMDVAMSDTTKDAVDNVLKHFGRKGMKWGVRSTASRAGDVILERGLGISTTRSRARAAASARSARNVTVKDKRKKIKTSGGEGVPAHPDAILASKIGQVVKKSGPKAVSNQSLQTYATRLQLEQNVSRLNSNNKSAGAKVSNVILKQAGNKAIQEVTGGAMSQVKKLLIKSIAR